MNKEVVAPAVPHGRMPPDSCHGKASIVATNVLPSSGPICPVKMNVVYLKDTIRERREEAAREDCD